MINKNLGFTLAEVLIALAVIGVVAALTLPSTFNKIKEKQYDTARQKVLSTVGEVLRRIAIQGNINTASNANDFVNNYLSRHIKIVKYCGTSPTECGFSNKIKKIGGENLENGIPTTIGGLNSDILFSQKNNDSKNKPSYSFLLANGYSINIYYNKYCINKTELEGGNRAADAICVNAIYDMNGKRPPNEFGKDIGFVSIIYPDETSEILAPALTNKDIVAYGWGGAVTACARNKYRLPSRNELIAISFNRDLTNLKTGDYWSGTSISSTNAWNVHTEHVQIHRGGKSVNYNVRCLKY